MGVITTIRTKFGSVIVVLIGLCLALYILSLALNDNTSILKSNKDVVGSIDGDKIHLRDYQAVEDEVTANYKLQNNSQNIDDNTLNSLREQAWNKLIQDHINTEEYSALGIVLTDKELQDMFYGEDALPEIKQAFTNPQTGQFDPVAVKNYYDQIKDPQDEKAKDQLDRWNAYVKGQKELRLQTKYNDLVSKAVYAPKWMAQLDYQEKNAHAEINFVSIPYTQIVDSTIKVTDADLQKYLDANKEKFKQDGSRSMEYVVFNVKPSSADTARVQKVIGDVHAQWLANPNDTDLVKVNNATGTLDEMYYAKDKVKSAFVKDTLFKVSNGTIIGPYLESDGYNMVQLVDRRMVPDSVKAKHILISVKTPADSTAAKKKADSLFNAIQQGAIFDSIAAKFSDDPGSKDKGGELGFAPQGVYVKPFNQFLFFGGNAGDMKVVRSQFGYHIIKIEEVKNVQEAVRYNFISKSLDVSTETNKDIYAQASQFAATATSVDSFKAIAIRQHLNEQTGPVIAKNAFSLAGVNNAREAVKWAYNAKKGDISPVITCDNYTYVVAALTGIKDEGTGTVEDNRQQLEIFVKKEKKGDQLAQRFAAAMAMNATLESIAQSVNQTEKTSGNVTFSNAYSENVGYEPKVAGATFGLDSNKISKPIRGESGVFVIQLKSKTIAPEIADYSQYKQQLISSIAPRMQYGITETIKKEMKVEDNRYLFF